jgi:hypothetical protein
MGRWGNAPDLVSSAGHDVAFPGRRVCPLRFLLRHYPFRTQAQATRKVFVERRPRLPPQETSRGWHVQYAEFSEGQSFLRPPDTLVEYDGQAARLALAVRNRATEAQRAEFEEVLAARDADIGRLNRELDARRADVSRLEGEWRERTAHLASRQQLVDRLLSDIAGLQRDLAALRASRSWRWTAPLRAVLGKLFGG